MKCTDHSKHRLRPDLFIKQHYEILIGRQMSFVDTINKRDCCKIKVHNYFGVIE